MDYITSALDCVSRLCSRLFKIISLCQANNLGIIWLSDYFCQKGPYLYNVSSRAEGIVGISGLGGI